MPTLPQRKKLKRRRTWETVGGIALVILSTVLPSAHGQDSFYTTCRGQVQSADANRDDALSEAEFKSFLFQISGGKAIFGATDLPFSLAEAFTSRQDGTTQLMNISASSGEAIDIFCKNIYLGLVDLFDIVIENNECISALQAGDTQPQNGQLIPSEYVPFLNSLTASQVYSDPFESLPMPLQNAFNDMAIDGSIAGSKGTEYLIEFCQRALLATITPQIPTTPAPALADGSTSIPTVSNGTAIPTPTIAGSVTSPPPVSTANATVAPSIAASLTLAPTFGSSGSVSNSSMVPTAAGSGTFIPTSILGLPSSTVVPTAEEYLNQTLVPTFDSSSSGSPNMSPTTSPTSTSIRKTQAPTFVSLSVSEFGTCKTALVISDINRNDELEQNEFVTFVAHMSADPVLSSRPAFRSIDKIYRDLYEDLSAKSSGKPPRLEGTKPGEVASQRERANILDICQKTYQAIWLYERDGPNGSDYDGNASQVGQGETDPFYQTCKSAMVVSDLDRNSLLVEAEFVTFMKRLAPDMLKRVSTFQQLDPAFRASFNEVSSARGIPIYGSKPGQPSTNAQINHLQAVCQTTQQAIATVASRGDQDDSPTSSPTILRSGHSSLSNEFFRKCKTAMLIADLDRDDILDQAEYVRLLNRLTMSRFAGDEFDDLEAIFQLGFYKVSVGGKVVVAGSKPGQLADRKMIDHLNSVCESVKESLDAYERTGGAGALPKATSSPLPVTPHPSRSPLTRSEIGNCLENVLGADENRNFLLEDEEFATFVATVTNQTTAVSFRTLPQSLASAFRQASGRGDAVDLAANDDANVVALCEAILAEVDVPTLVNSHICALSLSTADLDSNHRLTKDEYVGFVQALRDVGQVPFDNLPFLLRENFEWLTLGKSYIDISGVSTFDGISSGDDIRIQWMCDRTAQMLAAVQDNDSITMDDHCANVLHRSDADGNGYIDQSEFMNMLREFSGAPLPGLGFLTIDTEYRNVFNVAKSNDNEMIDVETASANGLCFELRRALDSERGSEAFFEQCVTSLRISDANADESLNKEEYISFLYNLAAVYGRVEVLPDELEYQSLNEALRLNYDVLSGQQDDIRINGSQFKPTEAEVAGLRWVCQNTEAIIDTVTTAQDMVVTVYNAFLISNKEGIEADDLQNGANRDLLDEAYSEFVEEQIREMLTTKRFRRFMVGEIIGSSASVYQIDDARCFSDVPKGTLCQVVYGSFDLSVAEEDDFDTVASKYSETMQSAIDRGGLQSKLLLLDSSAVFEVIQAAEPVQPSSASQVFVPNHKPEPSTVPAEDEQTSLFLTLLSGALVSSAIFGTLYYWFFYIRKGKTGCGDKPGEAVEDVPISQKSSEQTDASRTVDDEETGISKGGLKNSGSKFVRTDGLPSSSVSDESSNGVASSSSSCSLRSYSNESSSKKRSSSKESSSKSSASENSSSISSIECSSSKSSSASNTKCISAKKDHTDEEKNENSQSNDSSSSSQSFGVPHNMASSAPKARTSGETRAPVLSKEYTATNDPKLAQDKPIHNNIGPETPNIADGPAYIITDHGNDASEQSETSDIDQSSSKTNSFNPDKDDAPQRRWQRVQRG